MPGPRAEPRCRALRVSRRFRRLRRRRARVVEIVAGYAAEGAVVLKGNHDEAIEASKAYFNDAARAALEWARETLETGAEAISRGAAADRARGRDLLRPRVGGVAGTLGLRRQPVGRKALRRRGGGRLHVLRPRPRSGALFRERGRTDERVPPVAGTPIPVRGHRRWVAIVGSVGQPRDRNPAAAYALFDAAAPAGSPSAASPTTPRRRRQDPPVPACPVRSRTASSWASRRASCRSCAIDVQPGAVIDGYRVGECIHKGGTAPSTASTAPAEPDPGFPLVMKAPRPRPRRVDDRHRRASRWSR